MFNFGGIYQRPSALLDDKTVTPIPWGIPGQPDPHIISVLSSQNTQKSMLQPINLQKQNNSDYSKLLTKLSPDDELAFQKWKTQYAPKDSGADYDLRGAYVAGLTPDPQSGHWPDTFKLPNHPTFSDQSKFAQDYPELAGSWDGDVYVKPKEGQ